MTDFKDLHIDLFISFIRSFRTVFENVVNPAIIQNYGTFNNGCSN